MSGIRCAVAGFKHFHILEFVKGMKALPGAEFVGFYDDDSALRSKYGQEFGVPAFDSLEKLVEVTQPEVVGVADVNGRKADTICRLAELGCHVLADKPLVTTLAGLDRVEQAAAKTGKKIGLMLLERYNAPVRAVRAALMAPDIWAGWPASPDCRRTSCGRPTARPGSFQPESVWRRAQRFGDSQRGLVSLDVARGPGCRHGGGRVAVRFTHFAGFTDHAEVFLEFADSSTAMLRADWLTPEAFPSHGDGRQIFEGTNGTVEVLAAPDIHTLGEGEVIFDPWDRGRERLTPLAPLNDTVCGVFRGFCRGASSSRIAAGRRLSLYAGDVVRPRGGPQSSTDRFERPTLESISHDTFELSLLDRQSRSTCARAGIISAELGCWSSN